MNPQISMNPQTKPLRLIIQGVNGRGQQFRPRDWAERLCSCLATFGPGRKPCYSPFIYVSFRSEIKSLVVEAGLWEKSPNDYDFLLSFAQENDLRMIEENEQAGFAMAVGQ